jgi:predicted ATPase/DNA-binding XRE family transcriptional regulator
VSKPELTFGLWLRKRRKSLRLTQAELARRVPCSEGAIRQIESSRRQPSAQMAKRLAECLDVPPDQRAAWVNFARGDAETWAASARPPAHLPRPPTPLIGREAEVAAACQRLRRDDARLLTLVGPPGIGKTRLSLQIAAELRDDFEQGVFFIPLDSVTEPELVPTALAQTLGIELGRQAALARLKQALTDRHLLLVLDNFEQVVAAAPAVAELLAECPWLKAIVTSRAPLRLRGERQFPVPPLAADLARQLFVERAQAVRPDFALTPENAPIIAELCARLDGLPLAIELIAARIKLLTPQSLLARLSGPLLLSTDGVRGVPDRQRTLEAAIRWSYDLLTEQEQTLFARLGVFVGGWTLEAAEQVCSNDTLNGLSALLDKSLIQRAPDADGEPRFTLLVTLRAFAQEQLAARGESEIMSRRHAECFLALAERAEPELYRAQQAKWIRRLEVERENFRAVLTWALDYDAAVGLRLASALWWFWAMRGDLQEGREWLSKFLNPPSASGVSLARTRALWRLGMMAFYQGDTQFASAVAAESLALSQRLEDADCLAHALVLSANVAQWLGQISRAEKLYGQSLKVLREYYPSGAPLMAVVFNCLGLLAMQLDDHQLAATSFEEGLALARQFGDLDSLIWLTQNVGLLARRQGDNTRAITYLEEALALGRELGEKRRSCFILAMLGMIAGEQGDDERAAALLEESLRAVRDVGDTVVLAQALRELGLVALRRADYEAAAKHLNESLRLGREVGMPGLVALALRSLGDLARAQNDLFQANAHYTEAFGIFQKVRDKLNLAACLRRLASVSLHDPARAARLFGAEAELRDSIGAPIPPVEKSGYEQALAVLHAVLNERALAAAWAAGRATLADTLGEAFE